MTTFFASVFDMGQYSAPVVRQRARLVYALLGLLAIAAPILGVLTALLAPALPVILILGGVIVAVSACAGGMIAVRRGYLMPTSQVLLASLIVLWAVAALVAGSTRPLVVIWPAVLILLSAVLQGAAGLRTYGGSVIVAFLAIAVIESISTQRVAVDVLAALAYATTFVLVRIFLERVALSRQQGQTEAQEVRDTLVEINQQLIRQAAQRPSLDALLRFAVDLLVTHFAEVYHAQVFLLGRDKVQAELRASTGEVGERLLARHHSLAVGSLSIIGQVTLRNEPVIARVDAPDSVHRANPLLPETRLEAAFPLRIGGEVIGALDVQSRQPWDLGPQDQALFQTLADNLSLVIDNIQQFEQARTSIEENRRLTEQANRAMFDVERLNQRLIGRAWSEYLGGKDERIGFAVDFLADTVEANIDWTPGLAAASRHNAIVQEGHRLSVPLRVRGQVIGAMEFELDDDHTIMPEELAMIQEISERFGLAAENTRLVEQSQRDAQREALINEISSRLQATNDVAAMLGEAARSLSDTLQANRVVIKLGDPEPVASPNPNGSRGK